MKPTTNPLATLASTDGAHVAELERRLADVTRELEGALQDLNNFAEEDQRRISEQAMSLNEGGAIHE